MHGEAKATLWCKWHSEGSSRSQAISQFLDKKGKRKRPYRFSKDEILLANQRSMNVRFSSGIDWRPCKLFGKEEKHLKSIQWKHVIASGILTFWIAVVANTVHQGVSSRSTSAGIAIRRDTCLQCIARELGSCENKLRIGPPSCN